ncbi:MAG: hypothetical protein AB1689_25060 [Thermodesulfobacteriota bacterium]
MESNVGPGALFRLIGGALRLDGQTFARAVADPVVNRLGLAIVVMAALSNGFAYAAEAVAKGMVGEREYAVYRLLVIVGVVEVLAHFFLFTALAWLLRCIVDRPLPPIGRLLRPLAIALAPSCLLFLGALVGYPDVVRGVLALWRLIASVVALRAAVDASWLGAVATVLVADLAAAPLVDLTLFGVSSPRPTPGLPT